MWIIRTSKAFGDDVLPYTLTHLILIPPQLYIKIFPDFSGILP